MNDAKTGDDTTVFTELLSWMEEIESLTKTIRQRIDEAEAKEQTND